MKYNVQARLLHWLSALVILWATASGFLVLLTDLEESTIEVIAGFNVAITTLFIPFFIWRIVNRVINGVPEYPDTIKHYEVKAALSVQVGIYFLVSVVLVSGVLMMDQNIDVFGLFELPQLIHNVELIHFWETAHQISTRILAIFVLLHVAAVVRHERVGNKILKRML